VTEIPPPNHKGRTLTVPDPLRGGTYEGPDLVTALQLYGTDTEYPLPPERKQFTAGAAPDQNHEIVISSAFVSARHCRFERRLEGHLPVLQVVDWSSKNGTWFEGKRESSFPLRPGKMFVMGTRQHCFLALNDQMRAHYPTLAAILGFEDEHVIGSDTPTPSALIVAAVNGPHLLITGEPDCGQARLAQIVHAISLFRDRTLHELEQIPKDRAKQKELASRIAPRSTLVLRVDNDKVPVASAFASTLFSTKNQVRVIALARSVDAANEVLGRQYVRQMQEVWVRPLSQRAEAIHRLLDRLFIERHSPLRVADLTPENQQALRAHGWPENLVSLERAADWLIAIARHGSFRKAGHELQESHSTVQYWFATTMKLTAPLVAVPVAT
jgi:FHA domain